MLASVEEMLESSVPLNKDTRERVINYATFKITSIASHFKHVSTIDTKCLADSNQHRYKKT